MTMLPQGFAALPLQSRRAFPSQRVPRIRPRHLTAAVCAMLCTAHRSDGAAAPLSSAAHTTLSARTARSTDGYAAIIEDASARFNVPPSWIRAVIAVESNGDAHAVSPKGATGLMQLMPATWATLRERYRLGADPFDPHDNIVAGAAYLRLLYDAFGLPGFLAAYNAGPGRYRAYLAGLHPLPVETKDYLARLTRLLPDLNIEGSEMTSANAPDWHGGSLFVLSQSAPLGTKPSTMNGTPNDTPTAQSFAPSPHSDGLFVRITKVDSR